MAFDRPIEADRVDDLGLLSSFVRAPIIGPIMWILGGSMAQKQREEEDDYSKMIGESNDDGNTNTTTTATDINCSDGDENGDGGETRRRRLKQERCGVGQQHCQDEKNLFSGQHDGTEPMKVDPDGDDLSSTASTLEITSSSSDSIQTPSSSYLTSRTIRTENLSDLLINSSNESDSDSNNPDAMDIDTNQSNEIINPPYIDEIIEDEAYLKSLDSSTKLVSSSTPSTSTTAIMISPKNLSPTIASTTKTIPRFIPNNIQPPISMERKVLRRHSATIATTTTTTKTAAKSSSTESFQAKKTRKMSWMDETGSPLVQYYDESSLPQRSINSNTTPKNQSTAINSNSVVNPSSSALKPMKSAMRHSKSQYSVSLNISNEDSSGSGQYTSNIKFHPRECVPSGLRVGGTTTTPLDHSTSTNGTSQNHGNGTALMMPSGAKYFQPRPQHVAAAAASAPIGSTNSEPTNNSTSFVPGTATAAANAANGYISPQWGWYISTTPPTQEHYASTIASHSATKKNNSSETSADSNTTTNKTTSSTSSQPKPPKVNWSRHPAVTANNKNSPSRHVPTAFITNGGTPANIMMPKKAPPKVFRPFNPTCNTTGWPSVPL